MSPRATRPESPGRVLRFQSPCRNFVTYRFVIPMTLTAGASRRSETASPKYPRLRRFETSKILCFAAQRAIAFRNPKPVKTTVLTKRTPGLWRKAAAARTPPRHWSDLSLLKRYTSEVQQVTHLDVNGLPIIHQRRIDRRQNRVQRVAFAARLA